VKLTLDHNFRVPSRQVWVSFCVNAAKGARSERCRDGAARWSRSSQAGADGTQLEHVTRSEFGKGQALHEHVLSHVTRSHRMAFVTERKKDLTAPNAERSGGSTVMLQVALTIAHTPVHRHVEVRHRGLWHAALGGCVKRDDARFCHHGDHSA
tara:strand:+ start:989 stop:1447 length:459 start_codon:yes stop_codon:yes gene_type:complete